MKILKVLALSVLGFGLFAFVIYGGPKVPKKVKDAFTTMFPTAKSVKWDKESKTEWEAEFKIDKVEYSANFLEDGTWQETEQEIDENDVPQNVKNSFSSTFEGYDVKEAELSKTPTGTVYEFEIKEGKTRMEVAIDLTGKVVKKEMMKKEEKDND